MKIEVAGASKPLCDDFRYMRIKYSADIVVSKDKEELFLVQGHLRDNIKLLLYTHNCCVLGPSRM